MAYQIGEAVSLADASELVEKVHSERGLMLGLFGPAGGYWYAQFIDARRPESATLERYVSANSCAEAIRLAAERAGDGGVSDAI